MNVKHEFVSVGKGVVSLCAALVVAGVMFLPGKGTGQIINMNDNGSQASVDLGSQAGMYNWSVNGQNQLLQQWFWYQTDGGVAHSIDTIGGLSYSTPTAGVLSATYQNAQLSLTIQYVLQGGGVGSGNADMLESISIQNVSSSALNLNFYEYSHFNLLGTGNNTVQLFGSGGTFSAVRQSNGATAIQEAIVSPFANYGETAFAAPSTPNTLNNLNTIPGYVLNDNALAGPGDVTWAFQWVQNDLAPGAPFDVFKDKSLSIGPVPEPSTLALIALGLGAWGMARRRHSS